MKNFQNLSTAGKEKWLPVLAVLAVIAVFSTKQLYDRDVIGHLAIGKYIVEHKAFIYEDPFSYITKGIIYIDLNWLYQVTIYVLYSIHPFLISFLQALAVLAAFILIAATFPVKDYVSTALILFLGFFAVFPRLQGRPETFTLLFMAAYLFILEKSRGGKNLLFILIPLQIIWINVHSLAVLGPALAALFFLSEPKKSKRLLPYIFLCLAATFINPYGYKWISTAAGQFFQATGESSVLKSALSEILPPALYLKSGQSIPYFILLVLTAVIFIAGFRKLRLFHLLLTLPFFFLSITAYRNTALFAVAAVFSTLSVINSSAENGKFARIPCYLAALVWLFFELQTGGLAWKIKHDLGYGVVMDKSIEKACIYVKQNNLITPNLYNNEKTSSYLMWHFGPPVQVYSDFRLGMAPEHYYREQIESVTNPVIWREIENKNSIKTIFWDYSEDYPFLNNIVNDKNWIPVYLNYKIVVFVKKTPAIRGSNAEFMRTSVQKLIDLYNKSGLAYLNLMPVPEQKRLLTKNYYEISYIVGTTQEHLKRYREAFEIYRSMIAFEPANPLNDSIKERLVNCYNKLGYEK